MIERELRQSDQPPDNLDSRELIDEPGVDRSTRYVRAHNLINHRIRMPAQHQVGLEDGEIKFRSSVEGEFRVDYFYARTGAKPAAREEISMEQGWAVLKVTVAELFHLLAQPRIRSELRGEGFVARELSCRDQGHFHS